MERAQVDVTSLIEEAIRAKQAQAAARFATVEETPAGEVLTWKVTPEQIARINAGEREALDEFYFENLTRLRFSAYRFLRHNGYVKAVASYEDLLQQVYCDLRTGLLKLRPYDYAITRAVFHSFEYAAVGGIDDVYVYERRGRKCQKQVN